MSELYRRHLYLNKSITYLFSKEIVEYDISSAGYNLCRDYNLLNRHKIEKLSNMGKKERQIQIGLYQRKDKEFTKALNDAFVDIRRRFFIANNIEDNDILSIKKDAIFCLRTCNNTEFNHVIFKEKNRYSSFLNMADCEFYYNYMKLDIKNINDSHLLKHDEYMISYINMCIKHFETSPKETQLRFMRRFIDKYKKLELDVGYYRNFDKSSKIHTLIDDVEYDNYWDDSKDELDISYNYINIIIPLLFIAI